MTAVAPPSLQPISQVGWTGANNTHTGFSPMSAEDVSRMVAARKGPGRTNSSSSLASSSSSNTSTGSILSATAFQGNESHPPTSSESTWNQRKKPTRGLWPPSKSEPLSGISTARPQPVASSSSGPSAASAISALHNPSPLLSSQNPLQAPIAGSARGQNSSEPPAVLYLRPVNGTFERKTITVPFWPDVLRIGRQTNQKTIPTPQNGYFDSKVLSRQHAEVWADRDGKIWIRDVKSSNGTFVNGQRLSQENKDSEPHELQEQDVLELGIDIVSEDQKTVVHHKVAARVEHAGIYGNANNLSDLNLDFGDLDPTNNNLLLPQSLNNPLGPIMRGRTGSQGSLGGAGRLGSASSGMSNGMANLQGQPRHMSFWLTPISMEQIVKRLNSEIRSARQQSQNLQRTENFVNNILSQNTKAESTANGSQPSQPKASSIQSDTKGKFTEPPAPPPQQPLPQKPDVPSNEHLLKMPFLKRTDTEKPKLALNNINANSDSSHQVTSLVEALTSATKELDSQSSKLRDLEHLLAQERVARQNAEKRAQKLESGRKYEQSGSIDVEAKNAKSDSGPQPFFDNDGTLASQVEESARDVQEITATEGEKPSDRLQKRLDMMLTQMSEMKMQMREYKKRAESAEEESAQSRRTLAEMVEQIRADDNVRSIGRKGGRVQAFDLPKASTDGVQEIIHGTDLKENGALSHIDTNKSSTNGHVITAKAILEKVGVHHGRPVSPKQVAELEKDVSNALAVRMQGRNEQLMQSAPYASIVGVVIIGVGLMAYLNGWQKMET